MTSSMYGETLETYRDALRAFYRKEVEPRLREFDAHGGVGRDLWRKAGEAGFLGVCVPEEYGGAGDDGLAIVVGAEELGYSPAGATSLSRDRYLHAVPRQAWCRGPEAALVSFDTDGRNHPVHGHDRAADRQRCVRGT